MKALAKRILSRVLARRGLTIARLSPTDKSPAGGYIQARETVAAAQRAGLSVCDYLEKLWDTQGNTDRIIVRMASYGAFATEGLSIVEIGAGTGRYMEKVLDLCRPSMYESYETARDWADWLQAKYPIVSRQADGVTLRQSASGSVDLVHAHGVFVYLPFLVSYGYWQEVWRVCRVGSLVVFDVISEACMGEVTVLKWLTSRHTYPCFLSKAYVVSVFSNHGFTLADSFESPYGAGISEYLVFRCHRTPQSDAALADGSSFHAPVEA